MLLEKIIQETIIRCLNPVGSVLRELISERHRNVLISVLFGILFFCINADRSWVFSKNIMVNILPTILAKDVFCFIVFSLICILSVNKKLSRVRWNKVILLLQVIFGIGVIIISFIHPVGEGYRLFGFEILLLFPTFYLVWSNRGDYDRLFKLVTYPMLIVGFIFFIVTLFYSLSGGLLFEGSDNARCAGIMANANCFSLIGVQMMLGGVYLLFINQNKWHEYILSFVTIGLGEGIILIGQMRVAILVTAVSIVVSAYYKIRFFRERIELTKLIKILCGCILAVLMICLSFAIVDINKAVVEQKNGDQVVAEQKQSSSVVNRLIPKSDMSAEQYSSGRLWIWSNYAKKLNAFGNNYDEFNKEEMSGPHYANAHNVFLEVGYRFGVPMSVLFILYMLSCGIPCLRYLFKNEPKKKYLLFPVIATIVFVAEALIDCALLPFFQVEDLLYYISIAVIIDRSPRGKRRHEGNDKRINGKIHNGRVESGRQQAYNVSRLSDQSRQMKTKHE